MDARTGKIYDQVYLGGTTPPRFVPMTIPPTPKQLRKGVVGRNDPCPCGSGKKFKRCHLGRA